MTNIEKAEELRFSYQRNRKLEAEIKRLKNELTEQVQLVQEHKALITELADVVRAAWQRV